jgi:Transposase IS4
MAEPDTRRIVGGTCWAKAEQVTKDAKRVYGSASGETYLRGTVLEVEMRLANAQSKRRTCYVKARYMCGNLPKEATLCISQLKASHGTASPPTETVPPEAPNGNSTNSNSTNSTTVSPTGNNDAQPSQPSPEQPEMPPLGSGTASGSSPSVSSSSSNNSSPADSTSTPSSTSSTLKCTVHGREWHSGVMDVAVNGPVPVRFWKMTCQYTGVAFTPGCDVATRTNNNKYTPYDFFMACFPKDQLKTMVEQTSAKLRIAGKPGTSIGELLKWFGINILITRFEFGDRASLWSPDSGSKFIPAPCLGKTTGMSRCRYDTLLQYIVWSFQPERREDGMSSENYRWMLVSDFVDRMNKHRARFFSPSSKICADESISRWYGLGGHWINIGLPMYVAMDRKPEDGCEIQNCCCGNSGIMMQLRLVKTAAAECEASGFEDGDHVDENK